MAASACENRRFGVDFIPDGELLLTDSNSGLLLQKTDGGRAMRLSVSVPNRPVRRMRVAEFELDPAVFPPEQTLLKRSGAYKPSDPAIIVPLSTKQPDDDQAWRYYRVLPDGTVRYRSELFALIYSPETKRALIAGFITAAQQATRIHLEVPAGGLPLRVRCVTYPHGVVPEKGAPLVSEQLYIAEAAAPEAALEGYLTRLARHAGSRPARALTGWSDWQYYRRSKTEEHVLSNVEVLAATKYPVQYVMIDDGFEKNFGDWLEINERFQHDLGWVARFVRKRGFEAGVWIAPFTAKLDSDLAKAHPGWLLTRADGELLTRDSHMGKVVALDFTHPEALKWLKDLTRTLVRTFGYRWLKLDGPLLDYIEKGVFKDRTATPVMMIRRAIEAMRAVAGDKVIIEGEGYYGPAIGIADTQRVTQDIQPSWHEMRNTTRDNLASTFYHERVWVNNPDAFILRDTPSPYCEPPGPERVLPENELELQITALALTGGTVMLTDRMDILKPERAALIDAFLPPFVHAAQPLPGELMHPPYPERFILPIEKPWGRWWIGACFNWDEQAKTIDFPLPADAAQPTVVDYWQRKVLPVKGRALRLRVEAHGVRLFSIRSRPKKPAIAGLIRHITQGGVEVTHCALRGNRLTMELSPSRAQAVIFIDPAGRKLSETNLPAGTRKSASGRLVKLTLPAGGPHSLELVFRA